MRPLVAIALSWLLCISMVNASEYDARARNELSHNDVKAFVYQWFAGFDHQRELDFFLSHLPDDKLDMHFPDWPIDSHEKFAKWYLEVVHNIQYNEHHITRLEVTGSETEGWQVKLELRWIAYTYDDQYYDALITQNWKVQAILRDEQKVLVISQHNSQLQQAAGAGS